VPRILRPRLFGWLAVCLPLGSPAAGAPPADVPGFDAARAQSHIHALLGWSPRSMGAPGHARTIDYIDAQLRADAHMDLSRQNWAELAADGSTLAMTNIVARLNPQLSARLILATHYDSIVRAYRDPDPARRSLPMPGANNSASGVAVLIEAARVLSRARHPVGVDFIFFDGEEGPLSLGAGDRNWRALGSPYFAKHIREFYPGKLPVAAVVFDMVCKRAIRLHPERSSLESAPRDIQQFWDIGQRLAPEHFPSSVQAVVLDDQTALAALGIPSFLLIDFEYEPYFNTTADTEDKCSAETLQAVGDVTLAYTVSRLSRPAH
jgi:glutaminyl-peptide cyclotransferase